MAGYVSDPDKPLTPKQEAFCQEYLVDRCAAKAAGRAGYQAKGLAAIGHRLIHLAQVKNRIAELLDEQAKRTEITADRVLKELGRIAFFDPRKLFGEDGTLRDVQDLDEDTAAVISGLDVFEEFEGRGAERQKVGEVKKWKFWDKIAALTAAGKHLGMFKESVEHSGEVIVRVTGINVDV